MALVFIDSEDITVSTSAIGPSNTSPAKITSKVIMATYQLRSGGIINVLTGATEPAATANNGEYEKSIGDEWEIWGYDNVYNTNMIRENSESTDGVVAIQYWGEGSN